MYFFPFNKFNYNNSDRFKLATISSHYTFRWLECFANMNSKKSNRKKAHNAFRKGIASTAIQHDISSHYDSIEIDKYTNGVKIPIFGGFPKYYQRFGTDENYILPAFNNLKNKNEKIYFLNTGIQCALNL